jgi:DNA-directed RNA polymerase specialized sigma24 family protein
MAFQQFFGGQFNDVCIVRGPAAGSAATTRPWFCMITAHPSARWLRRQGRRVPEIPDDETATPECPRLNAASVENRQKLKTRQRHGGGFSARGSG